MLTRDALNVMVHDELHQTLRLSKSHPGSVLSLWGCLEVVGISHALMLSGRKTWVMSRVLVGQTLMRSKRLGMSVARRAEMFLWMRLNLREEMAR